MYLLQCCTGVVLALDNDDAGMKATGELEKILRKVKWQSHILRIGEEKDVNEWIQSNPKSLEETVNNILRRLE